MLVLSLHNPQTCGLEVSAAPYQAQRNYCSQSNGGDSFNQERRRRSSCVFAFRGGMTEKDIETPPGKTKMEEKVKGVMSVHVCVCVPLKSLSNSKPQPKCTFASPEKPLTLSANVQDEIQTNFLLIFFPHLFLNRCCGFLFYYTRSAERDKKKN